LKEQSIDYLLLLISKLLYAAERIMRAERLGRTKKPKQVKEVVYPTTFRMKEGTEELDDPFGQAEYAYSLIEMEVNKNGGQ
jgi:hypothetical protein